MAAPYTIGELALAADVPTTTVRYYERCGLLRPAARSGSGRYRLYGEAELERLRFIRAAQRSGFVLEDVATLLELRDGETDPCSEVQELIATRLDDVARRLRDLQSVARVLRESLAMCRRHEREGRCEVIGALSAPSAVGRRRPRRP